MDYNKIKLSKEGLKMTERIKALTELTLEGKMHVEPVKTDFDRTDLFLSETEREVKRLCEYILNQEPKLTPYQTMTGLFTFDGSVVGDAFNRGGHKKTDDFMKEFYLKPIDNISTMEWQHATADYRRVLAHGIKGIVAAVDASLARHTDATEIEFLQGLKKVAQAMIDYARKCSERVLEFSKTVENPMYRTNLEKLSKTLETIPENPPKTFYEAVLTIYFCFSADPDSVGTLDRYLTSFYENDIKSGILTRDQAKEYLQELFLMLQSVTNIQNPYFTRGGQSHFCVGGYLPNGEDGFNDLSHLIIESLVELPTYIPEVSLRWTKKMSHEEFKFVLDCERHDPNKRIAFVNDEKRVKCYTEICGFPYEKAVNYSMTGCNETVLLGSIIGSCSKGNVLRCVETLFHKKFDTLQNVDSFDEFYALFEKELFADLDLIYDYDDKYNLARARDVNYISSLFFNDCIENAKSLTQGGGNSVISSPMLLGITNVIDSLAVVKQFVFDEKTVAMKQLVNALQNDWHEYEDLLHLIRKKGNFFGNDDDTSNYVAMKLYDSFYKYLNGKKTVFGYPIILADSVGYNEHHKWFGDKTQATPDGRHSGEMLKFGLSQSGGNDRNGLSALLNSVAKLDPHAVGCGSTVTNISLDEELMKNDESFDKTVDMLETFFQNGGTHFQLNYVSREELINAKNAPESYENLRVRVTGFSEYFVRLKESLQDDIIERTPQK